MERKIITEEQKEILKSWKEHTDFSESLGKTQSVRRKIC